MDQLQTAIEAEIPRLRRYAMYLARDRHRADDLVQDCLVRAIAHGHSWQPGTNLRAWLFAILRNRFITEVRRGRAREGVLEAVKDDHPAMTASANQLDRLQLQEVWQALGELSDEHREVLLLVVVEGFSYEAAAEFLHLPVGTVRSRLSRARSALRERLERRASGRRGDIAVLPRPDGKAARARTRTAVAVAVRAAAAGR